MRLWVKVWRWRNGLLGLCVLLLVISLNACVTAPKQPQLVVAIAASLKEVMVEMRTEFKQQYPAIEIQFNTGSSGTLERQIEQQAPIDVFASAALNPLEKLAQKNLVEASQIKVFAQNQLVLVQSNASDLQLKKVQDLGSDRIKKVAMGNPKTVPAGQYAQNVLLQFPEVYKALEAQKKLIFGENVRQVLTYIQNQDVDAGFIYQTDLYQQPNLRIIESLPTTLTGQIQYAIAPIKSSRYPEAAQQLIEFILSDQGQQILQKYGFLAP